MKKILLVLFSLLTTFSLMTIQAEGGKELAQENCASCHGNPDLNLISLKAMSYLTANEMFRIISEGKMKTQAENLTFEEKSKIADYLTKGDAYENGEELVYCSKTLDAEDLEEGRVGLVAAGVGFRRVDEPAADVVGFFCGCGAWI